MQHEEKMCKLAMTDSRLPYLTFRKAGQLRRSTVQGYSSTELCSSHHCRSRPYYHWQAPRRIASSKAASLGIVKRLLTRLV